MRGADAQSRSCSDVSGEYSWQAETDTGVPQPSVPSNCSLKCFFLWLQSTRGKKLVRIHLGRCSPPPFNHWNEVWRWITSLTCSLRKMHFTAVVCKLGVEAKTTGACQNSCRDMLHFALLLLPLLHSFWSFHLISPIRQEKRMARKGWLGVGREGMNPRRQKLPFLEDLKGNIKKGSPADLFISRKIKPAKLVLTFRSYGLLCKHWRLDIQMQQ